MKIGLVLPNLPEYSETFFNSKIIGLQKKGFQVVLIVNSNSVQSDLKCKIVKAPNLSGNAFLKLINSFFYLFISFVLNFSVARKLFILNRKDGFSFIKNLKNIVINSHILNQKLDWLHFGFGTMALGRENIAEAIGAKMAVSFRGFDHYVYPEKNKNCYDYLFSKNVKYHVLSNAMKKDLEKNKNFKSEVIKITPAINSSFYGKTQINDKDFLNIITVARLHPIKGLEFCIESMFLLKHKDINFHYTIVGDGIEKNNLLQLIEKLDLNIEITLTGKLSPIEVKNQLQQSNLYLQYSNEEGFCNALLEAQATGLISVVSDAEGLMENIVNFETGFVVPKKNPVLLANKIIETSKLTFKEKMQMSQNAIQRVKNEFEIEKQIEKFEEFYKNQ
jgi:glycosyltransferase involved in cell wall biosynthesis